MPRTDTRGLGLAFATLLAALAVLAVVTARAADAPPAASAAATAAERPARGARMSEVEARYGAPASRQNPVGQPPITRWDYPGVVVYFENDRVIHAVLVGAGG